MSNMHFLIYEINIIKLLYQVAMSISELNVTIDTQCLEERLIFSDKHKTVATCITITVAVINFGIVVLSTETLLSSLTGSILSSPKSVDRPSYCFLLLFLFLSSATTFTVKGKRRKCFNKFSKVIERTIKIF